MDAVATLHTSHPPIIHRDLKLENLLINNLKNGIKLCDFGSATTETFQPNIDWTINQVIINIVRRSQDNFFLQKTRYD